MADVDNVRNIANQIRFNRTLTNDRLKWGPTIYKKEFTSVSLTTVVHQMLEFVSENKVRMLDTFIHQGLKRVTLEIYYKKDERIEDANGEPVWLSDL